MTEIELFIQKMDFEPERDGLLPKFIFIGIPKIERGNSKNTVEQFYQVKNLIVKNKKKKIKFTISWDE